MHGSKVIIDDAIPPVRLTVLSHPLNNAQGKSYELPYTIQPVSQWLSLQVPPDASFKVALNGVALPDDRLDTIVPKPGDHLVVAPYMGKKGSDLARMGAMLALIVITQGAATHFGLAGMGKALFMGAMVMGGGLLINAVLPPNMPTQRGPSQAFSWSPGTMQRQGAALPRAYGRLKAYGNVFGAWTAIDNTTLEVNAIQQSLYGFPETMVTASVQNLDTIIALSEGPIEGIVAGTPKLQGRTATEFDDVTVTERKGTDVQTEVFSHCKVELRPNLEVTNADGAVTYTTPDKHFDKLQIILVFDRGLYYPDDMGDVVHQWCELKIEIRPVGGAWGTLLDGKVAARMTDPVFFEFDSDGSYEGGASQTVNQGTQYEIRVTKTTGDNAWGTINSLRLYAVREILNDDFEYPGMAYVGVSALATKEISGSLQFSCVVQGRVVRVYDGGWTIEYSNNPAWVLWDILTQPVITGDGGGTAYAIDSYQGIDPDDLTLADFVAFAAFCDALVDDGAGGTEARYTFDGYFERQTSTWDAARQVCASCRAQLVNNGDKWRVVIDQAGSPVQVFNVSNVLQSQFRMSAIDQAERAAEVDIRYTDAAQDYRISTVRARDIGLTDVTRKVSLNLVGCTRATQAWRVGAHMLRNNRYVKKMAEWTSDVEAIVCQIGDVVYVQHDAIGTDFIGGRVVHAQDNAIMLDKPFTASGDDRIIVRSISAGADALQTKRVRGVTGSTVKIFGTWSPDPSNGDVYIIGPATLLTETYRIIAFTSTKDARVRLAGMQYSDNVYPTTETPEIPGDILITAGSPDVAGGVRPPSWSEIENRRPATFALGRGYIYTPQCRGMDFADAGGGKVSWDAGLIVYKNEPYQIVADAVGTAHKWIFFDSDSGNPYVLSTSDTYPTGANQWLLCRNDSGTPVPIYGLKVLDDQYLLANGSRDLTGDWTISTNDISLTAGTLACRRLLAGG